MPESMLLVEDNASDEKQTLLAFKKCGVPVEIEVARDGAAALERLFGAPLPRLVALDLKLPKIDGLEVLRTVRASEKTRLVPIVVLTASRQDEDVLRSYELGANAYVRKPIEFAEFVESARTIATFWLRLNERLVRT